MYTHYTHTYLACCTSHIKNQYENNVKTKKKTSQSYIFPCCCIYKCDLCKIYFMLCGMSALLIQKKNRFFFCLTNKIHEKMHLTKQNTFFLFTEKKKRSKFICIRRHSRTTTEEEEV